MQETQTQDGRLPEATGWPQPRARPRADAPSCVVTRYAGRAPHSRFISHLSWEVSCALSHQTAAPSKTSSAGPLHALLPRLGCFLQDLLSETRLQHHPPQFRQCLGPLCAVLRLRVQKGMIRGPSQRVRASSPQEGSCLSPDPPRCPTASPQGHCPPRHHCPPPSRVSPTHP